MPFRAARDEDPPVSEQRRAVEVASGVQVRRRRPGPRRRRVELRRVLARRSVETARDQHLPAGRRVRVRVELRRRVERPRPRHAPRRRPGPGRPVVKLRRRQRRRPVARSADHQHIPRRQQRRRVPLARRGHRPRRRPARVEHGRIDHVLVGPAHAHRARPCARTGDGASPRRRRVLVHRAPLDRQDRLRPDAIRAHDVRRLRAQARRAFIVQHLQRVLDQTQPTHFLAERDLVTDLGYRRARLEREIILSALGQLALHDSGTRTVRLRVDRVAVHDLDRDVPRFHQGNVHADVRRRIFDVGRHGRARRQRHPYLLRGHLRRSGGGHRRPLQSTGEGFRGQARRGHRSPGRLRPDLGHDPLRLPCRHSVLPVVHGAAQGRACQHHSDREPHRFSIHHDYLSFAGVAHPVRTSEVPATKPAWCLRLLPHWRSDSSPVTSSAPSNLAWSVRRHTQRTVRNVAVAALTAVSSLASPSLG